MIAIAISRFGGPDVLTPIDLPTPQPGALEVLIRVKAAGVARADLMQREGKYPPPSGASDIPGLDVAGIVEAVGEQVKGLVPGQRVCAILAGGGYAEYCVAPACQVLPIPDDWTETEAATLPENLCTAFDNLITRPALRSCETVLIHGGTSGVGSMAIMLATAWRARVIATAGSKQKCDTCLSLGADLAIDYKTQDFVQEAKEFTSERGVDVVLDLIGGPYLARNLEVLASDGRISIVSTQGGSKTEIDLGRIMRKRARVMGSTMRIRTPAQKGQVVECLRKEIWPLLPAKDVIRPVIDSVFPLREAYRAHERMETGEHIGKIVLEV